MASEWNDVTFVELNDQAVNMTVPGDAGISELLLSAITEFIDLPHMAKLNKPIVEAFADMSSLLARITSDYWSTLEEKSAFKKLLEAAPKARSLAAKWKKNKLGLLLYKSAFVEEMSTTITEIAGLFGSLKMEPIKKDSAIGVVEKLTDVAKRLRDREVSSELISAETDFKKQLLDFLRNSQSKAKALDDATSIYSWLAKHLGSEEDLVRQELQEIKDNAADSMLHAEQNVDAALLEQLLLSFAEIEERATGESTSLVEDIKAKLHCGLCDRLMKHPVTVDSGVSFCKSCIERYFKRGHTYCPVTKMDISKFFVINVALQDVISRLTGLSTLNGDDTSLSSFGEVEEHSAAFQSSEGGDFSDAAFDGFAFDEAPEKVQIGLKQLNALAPPTVLAGFKCLIKCASLPGGPRAVVNAQYIGDPSAPPVTAIRKAFELARKHDFPYAKSAMKLLAGLTSDKGNGPDNEILRKVAEGLDVLVSLMTKKRLTRTRLLAAETVVNILANQEVRKTVRSFDGIVPALVSLSNVDAVGNREDRRKTAETIGLKGLQRLSKYSKRGDKTQILVEALLILLRKGLDDQPELTYLVRDSLVALESQLLKMGSGTSPEEVFEVIWKGVLELMEDEGFEAHATVPGRMAIINMMRILCTSYNKDINESLFLYLFKMMRVTKTEIDNLLAPSTAIPPERNAEEQLENLKKLLGLSVSLLCHCVNHGKDTARSVLRENKAERNTLEEMVHGENSGILDESRLLIQSILDQIYVESTPDTVSDMIKILVKLSKSDDENCRRQVSRRLRKFVEENQHLKEFKVAGGVDALLTLLRDSNPNCQQDALIGLHELTPSIKIPVDQLPIEIISDFLGERLPIKERKAAVGLLLLIVTQIPVNADRFLNTEGALETALNLLTGPDSPGSAKIASALLEIAKNNESFRRRVAEQGLGILVKYVVDHNTEPSRRKLLTASLALCCRSGEAYQTAVIQADGHVFLLTCLQERAQEKVVKQNAAQGLLDLIRNYETMDAVLDAGFVTTALGSIDASFACTDIALGLASISTDSRALNQIYSDSSSVSALFHLLERCPDRDGKDAAASVIGRLYSRLHRPEDQARQTKIAQDSDVIIKCLDPSDMSRNNGFLEALAAIAAETTGRKMIHEYRGHLILIENLSVSSADTQSLMLKILAEMSSDVTENGLETRDARRIRGAFMEPTFVGKLFDLFKSPEFNGMENLKYALVLFRNLSLSGSSVCKQLIDLGALTLVLGVLKRHETSSSVIPELAVKALEKFLDDPRGKQIFLKSGGIKSLSNVLNRDRTGDEKSISTIILTAVAKDPQTRRAACETIFGCDILSALNDIIFNGETSRIRWQAAVLMKLLAMYGPTRQVCSAINEKGCLDALLQLRNVQHCSEMANDVLRFLSEKSKDCKRYIDANT